MNEKCQDLPWLDHDGKESAVDPVAYCGQETIEAYIVSLETKLYMLEQW